MDAVTVPRSLLFSASAAVLLLGAQVAVVRLSPSDVPVRIVLPLTIALAPAVLWPHRGKLGVWVIVVGLLANLSVIVANGGLMPIERETVVSAIGFERASEYRAGEWIPGSKDVLVESGEGRAAALGDSIIVRTGGGGFAASPGDVVIWAGLAILAGEASVAWQRRERGRGMPSPDAAQGAEGSAPTVR
jgi:hypothetical protein